MSWKTQMSLVKQAAQAGDWVECEQLLMRAYQIGQHVFGPHHGETGLVLLKLAEVCDRQGKGELADAYRREVDQIVSIYRNAGRIE